MLLNLTDIKFRRDKNLKHQEVVVINFMSKKILFGKDFACLQA